MFMAKNGLIERDEVHEREKYSVGKYGELYLYNLVPNPHTPCAERADVVYVSPRTGVVTYAPGTWLRIEEIKESQDAQKNHNHNP